MARCESTHYPYRKRLFHGWSVWSKPLEMTYRGVVTIIQTRTCTHCGKVQVKAL